MIKTDIYNLVTELLNGIQIDTTTFNALLDNSQMEIEDKRPWVQLRASDQSQTIGAGNNFQNPINLPTSFKEWYEDRPIQLLDSQLSPSPLSEIPFSELYIYKQTNARFAVDYPNSKVYILGNLTQSYTVLQNFIKIPTLVSSADSATWVFPVRFHKILALLVAAKWKNGIDYDVFSNAQANQQNAQAAAILESMITWDSRLQNSMTKGIDPFSGELGFNSLLNGTRLY